MSRIFIYDASPDRIRTLTACLEDEGHDVCSNMHNVKGPISAAELNPTRALNILWTNWDGILPDILILECLDVDSAKFLEELHKPFFKKDIRTAIMSRETPRINTLLRRLMAEYNAVCMPRTPFSIARFLQFMQEIPV